MNKKEELKEFLVKNFEKLKNDGFSGENINHPPFELSPRDYLQFAESDLKGKDDLSLINCVSNIKRAMDCQIDTFFYSYNLFEFFKSKRLGMDKKLEFLKKASVFNSGSLSRLNAIRNKMEHEFVVPKIQDIELYFDLVSAFVSVLENNILMLEIYAESTWYIKENGEFFRFEIQYSINEPQIMVSWGKKGEDRTILESSINNIEEFSFFLKVFFLISKTYIYRSKKYIISQLVD
ncbi:hypothetical protein [Paenibacillus sp. PAMC 26794]|uniref:hypothetical protein n=1 Tax=Paenibacillus sp. PAMC 26794 TaxID=1257080 RepID=UPI0002DA75A6|nr:hypothetical protein [Paenibacillus sp. PAMC 26794]